MDNFVFQVEWIDSEGDKGLRSSRREMSSLFGVVVADHESNIKIALSEKKLQSSHLFSYCRALSEYFTMDLDSVGVVSSTESWSQQVSRAFAAEFLAPIDALVEKLGERDVVFRDDIAELSDTVHVSEWLIRHQIENQTSMLIIDD